MPKRATQIKQVDPTVEKMEDQEVVKRRNKDVDHWELGAKDGGRWAKKVHPHVLRYFYFYFESWERPFRHANPDLWKTYLISLPDFRGIGETYSSRFFSEVRRRWWWTAPAWASLEYTAGLADGEKWSRCKDAPKALQVLRNSEAGGFNGWPIDPDYFRGFDVDLTPAHVLFNELFPNSQSDDFQKFWKRFVREGLDDIRSPLYSPEYVLGFGDGALGLSKALQTAHCSR